jgi:hypothetical protein
LGTDVLTGFYVSCSFVNCHTGHFDPEGTKKKRNCTAHGKPTIFIYGFFIAPDGIGKLYLTVTGLLLGEQICRYDAAFSTTCSSWLYVTTMEMLLHFLLSVRDLFKQPSTLVAFRLLKCILLIKLVKSFQTITE